MPLTQKPPCAGPGQGVVGGGPRPLWPLSPRPLSHPASPLLALLSRPTDNIPGRAAGLLAGPSPWDQFQCRAPLTTGSSAWKWQHWLLGTWRKARLEEAVWWAEGTEMLCRVSRLSWRQAGWGQCPQGPQWEPWPGWQDLAAKTLEPRNPRSQ